jgi:DNA-binding GntR family transcriptional regulator
MPAFGFLCFAIDFIYDGCFVPNWPISRMSMPVTPKKKATGNSGKRRVSKTTDELVTWARERIRTGKFAPGQRLIESDIMRETHASRNKVRDALQRLATEGLVTIEAFRGASVKSISWEQVQQIYHARTALEGYAARAFALSDDDQIKEELRDIQGEMNRWVKRGNHERFAKLNSSWHELIVDGANNEYFRQFLSRLTIPVYRLLFTTFYSKDRIETANADHQNITKAICEGNADEAERLMRLHIQAGLEALSEIEKHD